MSAGFTVPADTIISTIIILFTGEFLPKMLFKSNPNSMLTFFAVPAWICYMLLWPISKFAAFLAKMLLRMVGIKMKKDQHDEEFSKVDLDYLLQTSIDNANANEDEVNDEVKIFQNALEFSDTKVRDCMIPRTEINAVPYDCPLQELKQKFIETGNSKIIVYQEDIDHIVGYIHSQEMFKLHKQWTDSIRSMPFVPETMAARKLMKMLLQQKKSLAVVVDEYGGTAGLVALEDMVEEIFGEIEDEHDSNKYVSKQLSENEYLLSARLEIDKVNDQYGLQLPEDDAYMTVGGLILNVYQSFPKLNEVVTVGPYEFKIIKKSMTKIELVRLKVNQ